MAGQLSASEDVRRTGPSRVVTVRTDRQTDRQTDRHDENNSHCSQFCEPPNPPLQTAVSSATLHDNEEPPHVLLHAVHQVQYADPNSIQTALNVVLQQTGTQWQLAAQQISTVRYVTLPNVTLRYVTDTDCTGTGLY